MGIVLAGCTSALPVKNDKAKPTLKKNEPQNVKEAIEQHRLKPDKPAINYTRLIMLTDAVSAELSLRSKIGYQEKMPQRDQDFLFPLYVELAFEILERQDEETAKNVKGSLFLRRAYRAVYHFMRYMEIQYPKRRTGKEKVKIKKLPLIKY